MTSDTGQCSTDNYDGGGFTSARRMAMEFALSGLPAGASVTKATLSVFHRDVGGGSTVGHSLRGYPGNCTIETADILVGGTAQTFTPRARHRHHGRCHEPRHAHGRGLGLGRARDAEGRGQ